jgi:hypothetical protein
MACAGSPNQVPRSVTSVTLRVNIKSEHSYVREIYFAVELRRSFQYLTRSIVMPVVGFSPLSLPYRLMSYTGMPQPRKSDPD